MIAMQYRIVERRTIQGGRDEHVKPCFYVEKRFIWPLPWKTDRMFYQIEKARDYVKMMNEVNSFNQKVVK